MEVEPREPAEGLNLQRRMVFFVYGRLDEKFDPECIKRRDNGDEF
jgi:hypothetical protein